MKKAFGTSYKQREIVLVPFPYSDLSATKKRPVLIISNNSYNNKYEDVLVCVITSSLYKDDYSIFISNSDLETGMLPEKSVVKTHKLFTIHKEKIIKKFSKVNEIFFENVYLKISDLIKNKKY